MNRYPALAALAGIGLLGAAATLWIRQVEPAQPRVAKPEAAAKARATASVRVAEPLTAVASVSDEAVESSLMKRLHELAESDPPASLQLALEGNARFPASAGAPERGWIICRSLVNMQRFPEAVAEARIVVAQYPDTPWAVDVQRHLLVNPMTDPAERGYGKKYELE
jgi:hypothetical protein